MNSAKYFVFTDIDVSSFEDNFYLDNNYMIERVEKKSILSLRSRFATTVLRNKEIKIMFLFDFAQASKQFIPNLISLIKEIQAKHSQPLIYIAGENIADARIFNGIDAEIIKLDEPFMTAKELSNFIEYKFALVQIRLNYARCHHLLLKYLEKRCISNQCSFTLINDSDFLLSKKNATLFFKRNSSQNCYLVNDEENDKFFFKLSNIHLLGLYNPYCLFNVVQLLKKIQQLVKCEVRIVKNEFIVKKSNEHLITFEKAFKKVIGSFDKFVDSKKFKIQLNFDESFVLNRRLKISFKTLDLLVDHNATELLIDLTNEYFKCFSIMPICCRMQSIATDAIVYDFEKYTYFHLHKNLPYYLNICKILFPYISSVDENFLKRKYLEIIPVTLIGRLRGSKLENFTNILKSLPKDHNVAVIPLSNGHFRLSSYFNVSAEMLVKIEHPAEIQNAIKIFAKKFPQESEEEGVKPEDLECDSPNYFDYENVHLHYSNEQPVGYKIKNVPICPENRSCKANFTESLLIFSHKTFHVLACKNEDLVSNKILQIICEKFAQAFKPITSFFSYPVCQSFCDQTMEGFNNGRVSTQSSPEYISAEINNRGCNFWVYNEKFIFQKEVTRKDVRIFVSGLQSFEESEGVCLSFVKDRIDRIENMNMLISELNPDYYKATADFCYYSQEELVQFFTVFKEIKSQQSEHKSDFEELLFVVTNFGFIRFNNCVEICPKIFFAIKNKEKLLLLVIEWSKLMKRIYPSTNSAFVAVETPTSNELLKDSKNLLPNIAKNLNQMLSDGCDFELQNFCCIPKNLFYSYNMQTILEVVKNLRGRNMKVNLSPQLADLIFINNCCFSISALSYSTDYSEVFSVAEKIETINEDFDETILIKFPLTFDLVDYEKLEKNLFATPLFENVDREKVEQCLEIFEKYAATNIVTNIVLVGNRNFIINKGQEIYAKSFLILNEENRKLLCNASENLGKFHKRLGFCLPDNLMCLKKRNEDDNPLINQVSTKREFKNFSIIDDNRGTYLELTKVINDSLANIDDDKLLEYEWFDLIPRELLMDNESAKVLLDNLKNLKAKGIKIWSTNAGTISTTCVELPLNVWMQIRNIEKFVGFLDVAKHYTTVDKGDIIQLKVFGSGLFSSDRDDESCVSNPYSTKTYQCFAKNQLKYFLDKNELCITLNSGANLMLDNFLWMFLPELETVPYYDFNEMTKRFKNSVKQNENDNMMSIKKLSKTKRNAIINLAKTINKNLKDIPPNLICHEKLKIFPKYLWEQCQKDYQKVSDMFQLLMENKIEWLILLNGNVYLGRCLTVTTKDILNLNNDKDKFKRLAELILKLQQVYLMPLICKEEVEYQNGKKERVIKTKITSYDESIKVRNTFLSKGIPCRIESNESLFLNNNIWVRAEDAVNPRYHVEEISQTMKEFFPNNKFQYGHPSIPILTSILISPEKQLFEYCYNLCQFIATRNVKTEYDPNLNLFRFNDQLSIHPRSFFHLQDMEEVLKILIKFRDLKTERNEFLQKKHEMSNDEIKNEKAKLDKEEKNLCIELWKIKHDERIEFTVLEEKCFEDIGKIIKSKYDLLKSVGNIGTLKIDEDEPFWGVKEIKVQNKFIFQNGSSVDFTDIDKDSGDIKLKPFSGAIVDAILMANSLQEPYKCCMFSDFLSVVEIVDNYDGFKKYLNENGIEGLPKNEQNEISKISNPKQKMLKEIHLWLRKVKDEQNKKDRLHIFGNELNGLHHWFKHPQSFNSLSEYYSKMNEFFNTTDYDYEVDIQTGEIISRHHVDRNYVGYYGIGFDESRKKEVLSFQYMRQVIPLSFNISKNTKFLVISDMKFENYTHYESVILNNTIDVHYIAMSNFRKIRVYIDDKKYDKPTNTEKLLLFFPIVSRQEMTDRMSKQEKGKGKTEHVEGMPGNSKQQKKKEKVRSDNFPPMIKSFIKVFNNCDITFCYPSDIGADKIESLKETIIRENLNIKLLEVNSDIISDKSAVKIKKLVETSFGL